MYAETGIFGVYIAARKSPRRRSDGIADALRTVIRELHNLALNVPEDELKRTKNQLKSSLLMNLETSSVSFDVRFSFSYVFFACHSHFDYP